MTLALLDNDAPPLLIAREPQGVARSENELRDLLFAHPALLPVHEIDPGFGKIIAVAKELVIPDVGRIDALLVDERGKLIVVEAKLWRNPQARREVVGQILDYARELARFTYEDLQRQISIATRRSGNVLYDLACEAGATAEEARFVNQVSRDLRAGRFLLLIVGDGITEGTHRIGEFLNTHAGLAFDFAMVELAQYRFADPVTQIERVIMQPRLIAKTVLIERGVIRNETNDVRIEQPSESDPESEVLAPVTRDASASRQEWKSFAERFIPNLKFDDPGQPPPRVGGVNWMSAPLPGPGHLTLYRSKGEGVVGAFVTWKGSEGRALFEALRADKMAIDEEFSEAGMDPLEWVDGEGKSSIALKWPSKWPWDAAEQQRQMLLLSNAANQIVNSFRPRLARLIA